VFHLNPGDLNALHAGPTVSELGFFDNYSVRVSIVPLEHMASGGGLEYVYRRAELTNGL
jgi:hypothetical protein